MLRLYLSDEVRLHVWDSKYRLPDVSPLHTHPWSFDSKVVAGRIQQTRYLTVDEILWHSEAKLEHFNCATILCGEGAMTTSETTVVWLSPVHESFDEGTTYTQHKDEIHESMPLDGTVTLVTRQFHQDRDHARVFWRGDGGFVSAEPRKATPEEVADITRRSLEGWF